jgi:iron-sulfur cluster insertion protein
MSITVTAKAADKIKEIAQEEELEGQALRLRVVGGGCAGFNYDLYFDDKDPLPMDEEFEDKGIKMVVDPLSFQYLDGVEIDYMDRDFSSGFKFNNPNVTSSCGCGQSFGI